MSKHVFTGVFIPAKIWLCKDLTPQKKMLLAEIKALSEDTGWCFASNGHFAEWLDCSIQNVSNMIQQLQKDGMIETTYMDQKTFAGRKIRVNLEWYYGTDTPYTGNVTPYTGNVTPYTGNVTEIQFKATFKKEEEETRERENSTAFVDALSEKPTIPAGAMQNSTAPAPRFDTFNIDTAAASLAADPLCVERFCRALGCDKSKAEDKHPKAVAEFLADQKASLSKYNNDRDFRSHYFNWLPLRTAAKRKEANRVKEEKPWKSGQYRRLTSDTTCIPQNLPVFS